MGEVAPLLFDQGGRLLRRLLDAARSGKRNLLPFKEEEACSRLGISCNV